MSVLTFRACFGLAAFWAKRGLECFAVMTSGLDCVSSDKTLLKKGGLQQLRVSVCFETMLAPKRKAKQGAISMDLDFCWLLKPEAQ